MSEDTEYTLADLFDEAKNDDSWEPDEKRREELVESFRKNLSKF